MGPGEEVFHRAICVPSRCSTPHEKVPNLSWPQPETLDLGGRSTDGPQGSVLFADQCLLRAINKIYAFLLVYAKLNEFRLSEGLVSLH